MPTDACVFFYDCIDVRLSAMCQKQTIACEGVRNLAPRLHSKRSGFLSWDYWISKLRGKTILRPLSVPIIADAASCPGGPKGRGNRTQCANAYKSLHDQACP